MSRQLPHHKAAEQSVLGSIFLDPKLIVSVEDELHVDDFFDYQNQLIYEAMLQTHYENTLIDFASVGSRLEQSKNLLKAGGYEYLMQLSNSVPTTTHLESYIDLVRAASLKREVIKVSGDILESGYNDDIDATEYVTRAEELIFALSQKRKTSEFVKLTVIVDEVREKIEKNKNSSGITGLKTGFSELDKLTSGLQPEELIILAARPSMGKSALALNLALNISKRNKNATAGVAVFSLEMSNDQLASRMISAEANIDGNRLRSGNLDSNDWVALESGKQSLDKLNILFDDSAAVTVSDIRTKCRKLSQEGLLDFVVIDYLQLIKGDSRSGNRQEEVARISRGLKQMARELKVPVLALSQLSREVEKREDKMPILADLRESGSIEQDADIVLFLYREDYYNRDEDSKTGDVKLNVAKNRQGQSGVDLLFKFDPAYSRFRTKAREEF